MLSMVKIFNKCIDDFCLVALSEVTSGWLQAYRA